MEFAKQEYWSGLLFSTPGEIPDSGIELNSPALAGGFNHFVSKYFFFFFLSDKDLGCNFMIV